MATICSVCPAQPGIRFIGDVCFELSFADKFGEYLNIFRESLLLNKPNDSFVFHVLVSSKMLIINLVIECVRYSNGTSLWSPCSRIL